MISKNHFMVAHFPETALSIDTNPNPKLTARGIKSQTYSKCRCLSSWRCTSRLLGESRRDLALSRKLLGGGKRSRGIRWGPTNRARRTRARLALFPQSLTGPTYSQIAPSSAPPTRSRYAASTPCAGWSGRTGGSAIRLSSSSRSTSNSSRLPGISISMRSPSCT